MGNYLINQVIKSLLNLLFGCRFFIVNSCLDKKTYKLVSVNEIRIQKRSAEIGDSNKFQFIEFGGKHMIKYNILNIDDL